MKFQVREAPGVLPDYSGLGNLINQRGKSGPFCPMGPTGPIDSANQSGPIGLIGPSGHGTFSKTAGEIIRDRHSRAGGNPQLGDNARFMDPRFRGGDACALYLPALFEKLLIV